MNELLNEWSSANFDDFWSKYGREDNPDQWRKYLKLIYYYEYIGILVKEGLVDPKLIYEFDITPIRLWEKYEPIVIGCRERFEAPPKGMLAEWFEDLFYVLKDILVKDRRNLASRLARRKMMQETLREKEAGSTTT